MFKINDRVVRIDKEGNKSSFLIESQAQLEYHQDLSSNGYKYEVEEVINTPIECEACSA